MNKFLTILALLTFSACGQSQQTSAVKTDEGSASTVAISAKCQERAIKTARAFAVAGALDPEEPYTISSDDVGQKVSYENYAGEFIRFRVQSEDSIIYDITASAEGDDCQIYSLSAYPR